MAVAAPAIPAQTSAASAASAPVTVSATAPGMRTANRTPIPEVVATAIAIGRRYWGRGRSWKSEYRDAKTSPQNAAATAARQPTRTTPPAGSHGRPNTTAVATVMPTVTARAGRRTETDFARNTERAVTGAA